MGSEHPIGLNVQESLGRSYVRILDNLLSAYYPEVFLRIVNADYFAVRHSTFIAWDRVHPNRVGATLMVREILKYCNFDYSHNAI